jgi:hypothetical protein
MKQPVLIPVMFFVLTCVPVMANAGDPNMLNAPGPSSAKQSKINQMFGEIEATSRSSASANVCAVTVIPGRGLLCSE